MPIRIAITEDVPRLAKALQQKVELDPDCEVIWIASNGQEAIANLQQGSIPDLLLMDIRMPVMNGLEATTQISKRWPDLPIVMATVMDDSEHILQAILSGAKGYLIKDTPPRQIHSAIREALEGGAPMSPLIATKALALIRRNQQSPEARIQEEYNLTEREREILYLLVEGLTYQQIADKLFISYGTVRKHVEHVYRKLEVHSKMEAIRKVKNEL